LKSHLIFKYPENGIWTLSLWPLNWSCHESGQGLDEQKLQKTLGIRTGLRHANGLLLGPYARKTKNLLKLNRDQVRWVVGLFTGHLSPKRTPLHTGVDRWPYLQKVPWRRWISNTYPMQLWGHSIMWASSLQNQVTTMMPHKQSPTFHSKCRINEGVNLKGKHNRSLKVTVQGAGLLWPLLIHSFINYPGKKDRLITLHIRFTWHGQRVKIAGHTVQLEEEENTHFWWVGMILESGYLKELQIWEDDSKIDHRETVLSMGSG
jgi:hypothetical protein